MNWFNIRLHVLLVLLISWRCMAEAQDSDEERVPRQQKIDSAETDTKEKARSNTAANIVDQIFSQPALRPSLAYSPGQSINYNVGYNLGRTLGKTPLVGASLDRQADASKVVLVLANDTPETSDLPQPDSNTLKRLVRTPGFWDQFASQMATFNQQLSAQVPSMSRTVGAGLNEFISQTPILGDVQQTGGLDFANLGRTFGETLPNFFPGAGAGDSSSGTAQTEDAQAPAPETERVENELTSNLANPLLGNPLPLIQGLQSFVPPGLQTAQPLGNMFQAVPAWGWLGQNLDGAASDISEVRVKPGAENPNKISPIEGVTQKMTEMKLRAAMKDALDKKTIPILWFSLPLNTEKQSNIDSTSPAKTASSMSDDDLIMRKKLEAFEKQLISELKTLQEVVRLANAMKKAQLEAKGKKFDVADVISPLALTNTPIYKITLADIEKTLKDEYVRKLLQMIYNSQRKDMHPNESNHDSSEMKYSSDQTGTPNKRQAATASEAMAHLNKDDMMKMMAYAYRMAAANGPEVPWQTDLEDSSKGMPMQQQSPQRQWIDPQSNMKNEQQRMQDDQQAEQRQWLEPNAPKNQQQFQESMQQQAKQRQWLEANSQMKQQPFQQTMPPNAEQRQWLEPNAQTMQQPLRQQAEQRQWLDANTQMKQPSAQHPEERQWLEAKAQMQHQQFQQQAEQRQSVESNAPMNQQPSQPTMPQPAEQRQWFEPNAQQPTQMRQMMPTNTPSQMPHQPLSHDASDPNMQMRQWVDSTGHQPPKSGPMTENKDDMAMQQQRQMQPSQMEPNEQFDANMNMRQSAGPTETNERQMSQNPQFQMAKMPSPVGQSQDSFAPMQRHSADDQAAFQQNPQQMTHQEERQTMAKHDPGMPASNEATPQMPENAGKERHKGLDDFMDDLDLFGSKKGKNKKNEKGTTINYYYNAGGSRYPPIYGSSGGYGGGHGGYAPPPPPPSYGNGGGYGRPSYGGYQRPQSGYYGGGGYGSNAYGSRGGYRTATGDDEIEEMLRQHQTLPKMMLLMQTQDDNRQPTIANPNTGFSRTTTYLDAPSASSSSADIKADLRSLAKRPRRKSRRRSRRSAEYASLEPIDESSLNQLRKTYKNTLREITLNPNESPTEALMRYNAESVREALAKASKEPMEISAGDESQDVGEKVSHEDSPQQVPPSYGMDNGGYMSMSTTPAYSQNHASGSSLSGLSHAQHHYVPQLNPQYTSPSQLNAYNTQHIQQQYSDVPSLYPYQAKLLPHNGYTTSAHNVYEQSYIDDYSVPSTPYQLNHNNVQYGGLNTAPNPSNPALYSTSYAKPEDAAYSPRTPPFTPVFPHHANAISKTPQQPAAYGSSNYAPDIFQRKMPQVRAHSAKTPHTNDSYKTPSRAGHAGAKDVQYYERTQKQDEDGDAGANDDSMGNLYEAMKERLSDCCNECKEKLLKDLTETLKRQLQKLPKAKSNYSHSSKRNHYQQEDNDADHEKFGDWLHEMVGKGYDKQYLTREHQKSYKKNDRIHLALDAREGTDEMMYGDNQSYKRDTTIAGTETEMAETTDADADPHLNVDMDLMTTEPLNSSKVEYPENEPQTEEVEAETSEDGERPDNINDKLENVSNSEVAKHDSKMHPLEPAESTTHSIYALRGKYKTKKHHTTDTLTKIYGKKIGGYKNLKLLGDSKSLNKSKYLNYDVSKVISKKDVEKHKNLEEILDLLYELSRARKEMYKNSTSVVETSTSTTSTTTSTTAKPSSIDTSEDTVSKRASSSQSQKPKRRRQKSAGKPRKSSKLVADSNQTSSLAPESSSAPASGTTELLPSPTSASPSAISEVASPPSASASEDFDYSDSPEQRSMFSFSPKLLKPFMGLKKVGRKDDPWLHKPYNLYQPIFTGGGTFESLLNRYRRQVSGNPSNSPQSKHVLTPGMLDRLLRIKVNFEKNYPFLYKTMMGHLLGDKYTTLSITPPEIPDQVSYPNVELATAEIHQLERLVEKLKKSQLQHQHTQLQQNQPVFDPTSTYFNQNMLEPLINSYNDEKTFWDEITDSPPQPNSYWKQFQDSGEATPPVRKRESFWSELEAAEEREQQRQQRHSRLHSADDLDKLFNIDEDLD